MGKSNRSAGAPWELCLRLLPQKPLLGKPQASPARSLPPSGLGQDGSRKRYAGLRLSHTWVPTQEDTSLQPGAIAPLTHPNRGGEEGGEQPHVWPGGGQQPAGVGPREPEARDSSQAGRQAGRRAPCSAAPLHPFGALQGSSQASHQPTLQLGFLTDDWLGRG